MSDPTVTSSLTKLLCSHGGRIPRDRLSEVLKLHKEQIEEILSDNSQKFPVVGDLVLAQNPVRICPKYLKNETEKKCDKLHLCKEYLQGKCKRPNCSFFHDISSHHNQSVLKVNEISELNIEEIKILLLQNDNEMLPEVCWCYMLGLCVRGKNCQNPHFCRDFSRGGCGRASCERSHDLLGVGAFRLQMSEVSISNFQMLCEVKHNERLTYEAGMMENSAATSDRRQRKRKNPEEEEEEEEAPHSKLPIITEESAEMPVSTAGAASASPVDVLMNSPSVSPAKPVPFPLQLVDRPNDQPMSLSKPSRLVDSLLPSVPLEKPVTTSITSPLVPQPFAAIMKANTPPAISPFTAPSSSYTRLPNSPIKGSAVPLMTPVTTPITSPSKPQSSISSMIPSASPAAGPSTPPSSPCIRLPNSPMKSPSIPLGKLANTSIASTSNPQPDGLMSSAPRFCVSQSKPSTSLETTCTASPSKLHSANIVMKPNTPPKARTSTPPSSSNTILVNSMQGLPCPSVKPETTSITSPSNPQQPVISPSTPSLPFYHPTIAAVAITGPVTAPPVIAPPVIAPPVTAPPVISPPVNVPPVIVPPVNGHSFHQANPVSLPVPVMKIPMNLYSPSKDPSVHFGKPVTTSTVSPSIPQPAVTITKLNTPPTSGLSTAPPSSYHRSINIPTKGPSFCLKKPKTTSTANPSSAEPAAAVMQPSLPTAAMASTSPSSSLTRLRDSPTLKGPSVPLENPVQSSVPSPTPVAEMPVNTAGAASASPVDVLMNSPSVSPAKPVPFPLQLVDRPDNQPMSLSKPRRLVDSLLPSVPLEKPVTTSMTSPLVSQPFAAIMKANTPPAISPFTAPSSSYARLPNSPIKFSAVPLMTPVTAPITSPSKPQSSIPFMIPSTSPAAGPSTAPSSPYIRLPNSPMKSPTIPLGKLANTSIASTSNPQPFGLMSSAPRLCVSQSMSSTSPVTTCTASPSKPHSADIFMKPNTPPKTRTSTPPSSSYTILVNTPMQGLPCPSVKPETTSIAIPSNPQQPVLSSSTSLPFYHPIIAPVTITGPVLAPPVIAPPVTAPPVTAPPVIAPQVNVPPVIAPPVNGHSFYQANPVSLPGPVVKIPMNLYSPSKDPSVHFGKPVITSAISPSIPQPAVTITKPIIPHTAGLSTAPPSSYYRSINISTKGPSIPPKKPETTSTANPSSAEPAAAVMQPSLPTSAMASTSPSSSLTRLRYSPTKGPSVPLESPVQSSVQSPTPVAVYSTAESDTVPVICLSNLWKFCNLGNNCPDMHYYLPYRWQIYKGTDWEDVPNMEEVEKCYCDPKVDRVPLIDLLTMRSDGLRVRRLSTVSSVVKPSEYVLTTEWLWYWKDEYGTWTQYGQSDVNNVTVSSSDLENLYLADDNAVIPFSTGSNIYEMNFRDMKQKNYVSKTERDVRRRPKYLSFDDVKLLKGSTRSAAAKSPLKLALSSLKTDIYPKTWDPESMPEVGCKKVLLSETSIEFLKIVGVFSQMVSGHVVKKMWRLQNPSLWQVFQWQKEQMNKVNEGRDVMELSLFHGTDSKHIDAICDQNFDWRICGSHGTSFGQGSYFSRHAGYSHRFSTPSPSGTRVMFVARVLVGDYVLGNPHMKRPPLRPGSSSRYYDSCVNNVTNPFIFVVFEKHQIYPEYLLEYEEQKKS